MITPQLLEELELRRQKFLGCLNENSIVIITNASVIMRNGDTEYPFRPSSDFYYLTGIKEPDAIAVFIPERLEGEYILFTLPENPDEERWTGKRIGQQQACALYGADEAFSTELLETQLLKLVSGKNILCYAFDDPAASIL